MFRWSVEEIYTNEFGGESMEHKERSRVMTPEEIRKYKYMVCCPLCDNEKCVRGTDKCEAEIWARRKAEGSEK